jgi:hypothetical protein
MLEALMVACVVCLLVLLGTLATTLTLQALVITGLSFMAGGLVIGVPAGAWYHVALYRCLLARGEIPAGFIWNPTRFHAVLTAEERRRVLPWFTAGALGFGLIMLGCTIFALGFLRL